MPTKMNIFKSSDEIIIVLENGGVACIREAEPIDDNTPRIATTDYYELTVLDVDTSLICETDEESVNIWNLLAEGNIYYEDWAEDKFDREKLLHDAIENLGFSPEDCVVVEEPLFPSIEF